MFVVIAKPLEPLTVSNVTETIRSKREIHRDLVLETQRFTVCVHMFVIIQNHKRIRPRFKYSNPLFVWRSLHRLLHLLASFRAVKHAGATCKSHKDLQPFILAAAFTTLFHPSRGWYGLFTLYGWASLAQIELSVASFV